MRQKVWVALALVGAMVAGGGAAYAANGQADWTLTLKVQLALLDKLGADSLRVEVDASSGALILTGTVLKRETRELAETVAKSVSGVESVRNDILLEGSEADPNKAGVAVGEAEAEVKDAMLEARVRLALVNKMGADGFRVSTEAASGVVTLRFDSQFTPRQRADATKVVRRMPGVKKVFSIHKV